VARDSFEIWLQNIIGLRWILLQGLKNISVWSEILHPNILWDMTCKVWNFEMLDFGSYWVL
jgi:hypothetical protein